MNTLPDALNRGVNYEIHLDKIVIIDENERIEVPISKINCGFLALNTIYIEVENPEGSEKKFTYYILKTGNIVELYQCLIDLDIEVIRIYTR